MRLVQSPPEIFAGCFLPSGKSVVDIGCATGELARWLTNQGARVVGLDLAELVVRARAIPRAGSETYLAASGENLPLRNGWADLVLYFASLHHLPPSRLDEALIECRRVLKAGGRAMFIEPVYRRGAYGDLTRLIEDETEVQRLAYEAILRAAASDLEMVREEAFYMPRSFADYHHLVDAFVEDPSRRPAILAQARTITERRAKAAGVAFDDYRFRSTCRLNVLLARRTGATNRSSGCAT